MRDMVCVESFWRWPRALAAAALTTSCLATQAPRLIIETDMAADSDDAAMLALAHQLADVGEVELLAVMHNGNNEWGGAAISTINHYYGRPTLPIGTYRTAAEAGRPYYHPLRSPSNPSLGRIPLSYLGTTVEGHWVSLLARNFPCEFKRRLDFPDAIDVYRAVLASVPNNSVVIVNGGFLGNLSNLFATFDVDPSLLTLFQNKVHRLTGAVGGVNTCDPIFPPELSEFVVNHPRHATATMSWFGPPLLPNWVFSMNSQMAVQLPLHSPVREAYRYKTEVEHQNRGTSQAWNWHIIDAVTGLSLIGWNQLRDPSGRRYFSLHGTQWLDVQDNCTAFVANGAPPLPHLHFRGVGPDLTGISGTQSATAISRRCLEDGIYQPPAHPWSTEREHRSLTTTFLDGTTGGLDIVANETGAHVDSGLLLVPTNGDSRNDGVQMITEGYRYHDQTLLLQVSRMPQVQLAPVTQSNSPMVEIGVWNDSRNQFGWDNAPLVQIRSWPGRGWVNPSSPGSPPLNGRPVYEVRLFDHVNGASQLVAQADVQNTPVGAPFGARVEVRGQVMTVSINGEQVVSATLQHTPPADGGMAHVRCRAICPNERFDLNYFLARPTSGSDVQPDVHVDKNGDIWFSYLKNGDIVHDLLFSEGGLASHFVDINLVARPGWGMPIPLRFAWDHPTPGVPDWSAIATSAHLENFGADHWVYAIRGFPWATGDEVVLEYRGLREGEQVPVRR